MIEIPQDVSAAIAAFPKAAQPRTHEIRGLIYAVARRSEIGPLEETLKWGQPAYLPPRKDGTTIRLGASEKHVVLYVHCQTDLVGRYRILFPDEFIYQDNRAVMVPVEDAFEQAAMEQMIGMALTYHRDKAKAGRMRNAP